MSLFVRLIAPVVLAGLLIACSDDGDNSAAPASPADGITEVTRQVLAESTTSTAPGQVLDLTRVIIPAGQEIAPHTHPGPQLAVIAEGTLIYTILKGEVRVFRSAGTADAKSETASAGQTVDLEAGDAIVETPGMEHRAQNKGSGPVVIYLSSLFPQGAPASSPVQ